METIRFTRRRLPHWEVKDGRYFITVRCADSLPKPAVARLTALHQSIAGILPQSEQFAAHQRMIFRTLEKFLDAAHGECPLRHPAAAAVIVDEFAQLNDCSRIAASNMKFNGLVWEPLSRSRCFTR